MGMNVGEVDLDLVLQSDSFKNQLNSAVNGAMRDVNKQTGNLMGSFKKLGGVIGGAFAVGKVVAFGKSCMDLGSDLAEVQNVVDVSFGSMAESINEFAATAIDTYGLSETVAKRYAGAFGAMSSSMGFAQADAVEMSKTLTGLAGDVASFYNISSDEAYTKLKSVFTGETESLKELGVIMTQTALDQYAMQNGFGKTTKAMTEQEKTALRYQFVMDRLSNANGDFARTSDSWANQTRVLALRFDALKASIGQGLINVFTPVIKMMNFLLAKLQVVANAFSKFTAAIMGKKATASSNVISGAAVSSGIVADNMSSAANSANNTAGGVADAAQSAEKLKRSLMGFDELNLLSDNSSSSGGAGGAGDTGVGDVGGGDIDFSGVDDFQQAVEEINKLNPVLQAVLDKFKELCDYFKSGFADGLGNISFQPLIDSLGSIKDSVIDIFTDKNVLAAVDSLSNQVAYSLGQVVGSAVSIGTSIATNLCGGLSDYLQNNSGRIKGYITTMCEIDEAVFKSIGNFTSAIANIFSAFGGENGQTLTSNIIGIFADAKMGIEELFGKFGRDIVQLITQPIIDNQDKFKKAFDGLLGTFSSVAGTIKDLIDGVVDKANSTYDKYIKPLFDSLAKGVSEIVGTFMDSWNQYMQPLMDRLARVFDETIGSHVLPMLDKAFELLGSLAKLLQNLWENILQPLFNWIADNVVPILVPIIENVIKPVLKIISDICDKLGDLLDGIKAIIDFLNGTFTVDWGDAWEGAKQSVFNKFDGWGKDLSERIGDVYATVLAIFGDTPESVQKKWDTVSSGLGNVFQTIGVVFGETSATLKTGFQKLLDGAGSFVKYIGIGVSTGASALGDLVKGVIDGAGSFFKNIGIGIATGAKALGGLISDVVEDSGSFLKKIGIGIATGAKTLGGMIGDVVDGTGSFFKNIGIGIATGAQTLGGMIGDVIDGTGSFFKNIGVGVATTASALKNAICGVVDDSGSITKPVTVRVSTTAKDFKWLMNQVLDGAGSFVKKVTARVSTTAKDFKWLVNNVVNGAGSISKGIGLVISTTKNTLQNLCNNIVNGVKSRTVSIGLDFSARAQDLRSWVNNNVISRINGAFSGVPILRNIRVPHLAQGGYVKANTPQLAMIGDNTHEGEVVAPESKLAEAVSVGMTGFMEQLTAMLAGGSSEQPINIYIGQEKIDTLLVKSRNNIALRSGGMA